MKHYIFNKRILLLVTSFAVLVGFFFMIDPEGKPLPYIFVPVVLVWVFLFCFVQTIFSLIFNKHSRIRSIISFVGVSMVVLLLLLSGVGQLTTSDIVLSGGLVLISSFYFYRMWS